MRPAATPPALITLILLTALSTLSLNMFLPSLATIATAFEADYALVSVAVAGYLAVTAVVQVLVGPLSDRHGRRPVLLGAVGLFAGASLGCALAPNVWTFLGFRMLQGGMITGYALSLAIVRDTRSEREAAGLIGYISMAMAVAPMLGPMLGGVLDEAFGWRATFWFYVAAGIGLLALCWADLGETHDPGAAGGGNTLAGAGALLRTPRFWGYALCTAFSTGAFYIFLAGAPLVARVTFDVAPAQLGVFIGSTTGGFMLGGFVAGRLGPRRAPTTLMLAGRAIACAGLAGGLALVLLDVVTPLTYFVATVLLGIGNGITMPGSNAGIMSIRPGLAGTAAGLNGALTVAAGAVLSSLAGSLLTPDNGAVLLPMLMLAVSLAGLAAALWTRWLAAHAPASSEGGDAAPRAPGSAVS
jgi:Bcr/CflA subfamily drug resistance transporter